MIVTAILRSGGTRFCIDLAKRENLIFSGQIDRQAIPFLAGIDKTMFHETKNQPFLTFANINDLIANNDGNVILNNNNPALFPRSTYFITRKDIRTTYHSIVTMMRRAKKDISIDIMDQIFMIHTFQIGTMYSYMKHHNIIPLYYEDLYTDNPFHLSTNDSKYCNLIDCHLLNLTNNGIEINQFPSHREMNYTISP